MAAGQVYVYPWKTLDVDRMQAAGRTLLGRHDFRGLASSAEQRENTVRHVWRCDVADCGPEIHILVEGNGFLYNMVRNIVGTLVEVGRGHWSANRIDMVLATRDRRNAGPTAPPDGLYMVCVHYDPNDLVPATQPP